MTQFTEFEYNTEYFNEMIKSYFPDNYKEFIELININGVSISGSFILQLIELSKYENTDIDIYINIREVNQAYVRKLIHFINPKFDKYYRIPQIYRRIDNRNDIEQLDEYEVLSRYLLYVCKFTLQNNKKIDVIFTQYNIEQILIKVFDYDILQNHWSNFKIYCNNITAIKNKKGMMTLQHFINRILTSQYTRGGISVMTMEQTNFINRYLKYTKRGFNLYIHNTLINPTIFKYILSILSRGIDYLRDTNNNSIRINNIRSNMITHPSTYIFNKGFQYIIRNFVYITKYNKIDVKIIDRTSHLINYILIAGIVQKVNFIKKLNNYSYIILNDYMNPNSDSFEYIMNEWYNLENDVESKLNRSVFYIGKKKNRLLKFK